MDSTEEKVPTEPVPSEPTPTVTPDPTPEPTDEATKPTPPADRPAAGPDGPVSSGEPAKHKYTLDIVVAVLLIVLIGAALFVVNNYSKPKVSTTPVSAKKDIAKLRVNIAGTMSNTVYPNTEADDTEFMINQQAFEGLTGFENETKVVPVLATSWTNPDANTWVFKIRTGVKFHDGNTLTAKQVKASLDQSKDHYSGQNFATTIKSVEVVDANTVKITTDGPDPLLTNKLTELLIWDTDANKTGDSVTGTGPYTISVNTKALIKLVAFDGYHGGHVYSREVDITQSADDVASQATVTNKTADLVATNGPLDSAGGYKVQTVNSNGTYHFVFNTLKKGSPLAKVAVRQALAQATDKATLLAVKGVGTPLASQTVPSGIPGYNPAITALTFNTTAAKAALVAAGYPKGFSITFTYYPANQKLADELKKEYAVVGVTLKLDPEGDQKTLVQKAIGGGTDMYFNSVNSGLIDGTDILSDFIDSANYKNVTLNTLNSQAAVELDPAKRVAILQNMSKIVADDQADIPTFSSPITNLYVGAGIHVTQDTQATVQVGSYFWKIYSE